MKSSGQIGESLIDELLVKLDVGNWKERLAVVRAFVRLGIPKDRLNEVLLQALLMILNDPHVSANFRISVAELCRSLGEIDDRVVEELVTESPGSDARIRSAVVIVLACLGKSDSRVKETLLAVVKNRDNNWVLELPAESLGSLSKVDDRVREVLLEALLNALEDADSGFRVLSALECVGGADDRVISALLKRLKSKGGSKSLEAAEALAVILQPKNCWIRIQREVQSFPTEILSMPVASILESDSGHKWQNFYDGFQEDQSSSSTSDVVIPVVSEMSPASAVEKVGNSNHLFLGGDNQTMRRRKISCVRSKHTPLEEDVADEVISFSKQVEASSHMQVLLQQANQAYLAAQMKGGAPDHVVYNLDVALARMDSLLRLEPKNPKFHLLRAKYLASKGGSTNRSRSIADFEAALSCCPVSDNSLRCKVLTERGITFTFLNELDKAIADYTEILRIDPNAHRARLCRGELLGDGKRNYKDAISEFSYVIDHCKEREIYLDALRHRLNTALLLEEYSIVVQDANDYLRIQPGDLFIEARRDQALLKLEETHSVVKNNQ